MSDYLIGSGAILTAGAAASITPATLHARVAAAIAGATRCAAIDLEGTQPGELARLLVVVQGWDGATFAREVTPRLIERATCSLAQVLAILAEAARAPEVQFFAHYLPDEATEAELNGYGVGLVTNPLAAIESAALISEQRYTRWNGVRAA